MNTITNYLLLISFFLFSNQINGQSFELFQEESNVDHQFVHVSFNGGGAAFVDIDKDGDDDLYLVGGDSMDQLFLNDGNGYFHDISIQAGLEITEEYYTTGMVYGDMDNDGDDDIYVNTYFKGELENLSRNLLLRNNGDLTFTEVWDNDGNDRDRSMTMGSTLIDYDLDGDLDIYNVNYVKNVKFIYDDDGNVIGFDHECYSNFLYRNNGNNSFTDVTSQLALHDVGCALAVTSTDYDNDGDVDILVANDFGEFIESNKVFRNDFNTIGRFTEVSMEVGAAQEMFAMGIAIGDYDNDLDLDYYITNLASNVFLEQENGVFQDVAEIAGVENKYSVENEKLAVSWGTLFADIDNDMDLDLFVANGFVPTPASVENSINDPDNLFINNGDKTFTKADSTVGIQNTYVSRGCAYSDIDMDGNLDIISVVFSKPDQGQTPKTCLFKNNTSNNNNWVKFKLEGTLVNPNAYGSKVFLHSEGEVRVAELNGGSSFCSHNSSFIHFGLGSHTSVDSVVIHWTGGNKIETVKDISINTVNYIKESVTSSIDDLQNSKYTIQPNPTTGIFTIDIEDISTINEIKIYDMSSNLIFTSNESTINLNGYLSGMYLIEIIEKSGIRTFQRVLKL